MDERDEHISELGEKKFLEKVFNDNSLADNNFLNGLNQDASIIRINKNQLLVSNIDKAPVPIILDNNSKSYLSWGYLAVTSSLSDILVVGADGISFLLSLTIPPQTKSENVLNIIKGAKKACDYYGVTFLGGDTKKGNSISVVGVSNGIINTDKNLYLQRQNSKPNDLIVTSGTFGGFASAYYKLINNITLTPNERKYIMYPKFPINESKFVNENLELFSSSMDNSDGLFNVLSKMFTENCLGYEVDIKKIPFSQSAIKVSNEFNIPLENFCFFVGDWNSVYTISQDKFNKLGNKKNSLTIIGRVISNTNESKFIFKNDSFKLRLSFENDSFLSTFEKTQSYSQSVFSSKSILSKV